ncbi:alpha/beta-hydrolase [Exidia glandulosa HHB12029]|uniref:Alpha/beta-hydrolase n=1 Tax=Exidia glandulosa HHB12029 TaxID=1314781 RepID=A0A166AUH4_EXIGL|nr:alpha/beta-hydrolase [Exidia glandulosa HHB12029]
MLSSPCARTLYLALVCACLLFWAASTYRQDILIGVAVGAGGVVEGPRVKVGRTVYKGRVEEDGAIEFFGGMRYALPPIGVRRFAPPEVYVEPAEHESERAVDASRWGKRCMQTPSALRPISDMSEDCLTANVFRPAGLDSSKPVPVMIWIYGGGFQSGTASVYNATSIVRRSVALGTPIVVLSLNYRLGPWSQSPTSPNLGLADQAMALSWARTHLPAFGGDVERTTVMGQSAGAMGLWHLVLQAAEAQGGDGVWWRGVGAMSGGVDTLPLYRPHVRLPTFLAFASSAGCPMSSNPHTRPTPRLERMLTCLRAVEDPLVLLDAHRAVMDAAMSAVNGGGGNVRMMSGGIVDVGAYGQFPWALSGISVDVWEERLGKAMKGKNVLVGANLDEGVQFVPADVHNEADALSMLTRTFNSSTRAERLWFIYSPGGEGEVRNMVARILGDVWFHAPVRALAKNVEKAWYYHYTFGRESGHVLHGAELQSLFWPSTSGEGMAYQMLDRWVSFVVHGHPGDEVWKPYPSALELNVKPRSVPLWRVEQIQAAEDVLKEMSGEWAR